MRREPRCSSRWSMRPGSAQAQNAPPPGESFEKLVLDHTPGEPMNLVVLPDGRVLHTTRAGEARMYDGRTGLNTLAGEFDVYSHDEEGLQSVAVDPNLRRTGGCTRPTRRRARRRSTIRARR